MRVGIVICSRKDSNRIPNKPFQDIAGKPLIERLLDNILPTNIKTILSVPDEDLVYYQKFQGKVHINSGHKTDPLKRMYMSANSHGLDTIIRVCHDKIFLNPELIFDALEIFNKRSLDYLYSSEFTDGTAFEIISYKALQEAANSFDNVEHISYAIKSVTKNQLHYMVDEKYKLDLRLLVDYEEDLKLIRYLYSRLGNDITFNDVKNYYLNNSWIKEINKLPEISVYTCAYNAGKYLNESMNSVLTQDFPNFEYILIDDKSTDDSLELMLKESVGVNADKLKVIMNQENIGLSSSCNVALRSARGKYIVRLDADDYFSNKYSLLNLYREIENTKKDVIYPNNFYGSLDKIQKGSEDHHIGGAIFNRRAINHIKFTDRLRNLEGLDFFERAKTQLNIGYLNCPIFFYRQRPDSMSKTNLKEREETRQRIVKYIPDETVAP